MLHSQDAQLVEPIAWAGSDTEAAFLSSLPLRKRTSEQGEPTLLLNGGPSERLADGFVLMCCWCILISTY